MPTYIKPGFWIKSRENYDHWLNLDKLIQGYTGNFLSDAPSDGIIYARQNGNWVQVTGGGGGSQNLGQVLDVGSFASYPDGSYVGLASGNNGDKTFDFISSNGNNDAEYKSMYSQTNGVVNINSTFFDRLNFKTYVTGIDLSPTDLDFIVSNDNGFSRFSMPTDKTGGDFIVAMREDLPILPTGTERQIVGFNSSGNLETKTLGWKQLSDLPTPPPFSNGVYVGTAFQPDGSALFAFVELGIESPNSLAKPNSIPIYQAGTIGTGGGTLPVQDPIEDLDAVNKRYLTSSFIPLTGTVPNKPLTQDIEISAPGKPIGFVGYHRPSPGIVYSTEYGLQSQSQYMYMVFSGTNTGSPSSNFYRRINFSPTGIDLSGFLASNGGIKADTYFGPAYAPNHYVQKQYVDDRSNGGVYTFNGDDVTTSFNIPHGLLDPIKMHFVTRNSDSTGALFGSSIVGDDIMVTFVAGAPAVGETIVVNWGAFI